MRQKDELLQEIGESYYQAKSLDINILIITLLSMVIVLSLVFPKIYISANIYYESLKIATLQKDLVNLRQENRELQQEIVMSKFYSEMRSPE
jgi:hypothetical protein